MASLRGVQPFIRNLPLVATSSLHQAHQVRPLLVNGVYAIHSRSFSDFRQNRENFSLFGRFRAFVAKNKISIGGSVLLIGVGSTITFNPDMRIILKDSFTIKINNGKGGIEETCKKKELINFELNPEKLFFGRKKEINTLSQEFSRKKRDKKNATICHLDGIGGIGKSAITFKYAEEFRKNYKRLIFVDCENIEKFKQSLDVIAHDLVGRVGGSKEETLALLKNDLDEDPDRYLLIFDNVDTEKLVKEVAHLIPFNPKADVIINGRHQGIKEEIKSIPIPVGELDVKDGLDLFKALLSSNRRRTFEETESKIDQEKFIKNQLGCLPKAIEMAAGYFENNNRTSRVSIKEYREIQISLDIEEKKWILEESKKLNRSNIEKTIYETYSPNIKAISDDFKEPFHAGKRMVYDFLRFLSFFGMLRNIALPDNSMDQLRECFLKASNKKEIYEKMGKENFKKFFEKIVAELARHKLIEEKPSKGVWNITIHQTIKEVIHYEYLYEIRHEVEKFKELTGYTKQKIDEYEKGWLPGLFYPFFGYKWPSQYERERQELEKKIFAWFFAVGVYFNSLINNREDLENPENSHLAILVSLVDFVDEYKISQPLKDEFFKELKILDLIITRLDNNDIDFLTKACAQLKVEDLSKLIITALRDDKTGDPTLSLKRAETISYFGATFIDSDLERAKKLSKIALNAGSKSANHNLAIIYLKESSNFKSGSNEEMTYLWKSAHHQLQSTFY